jgi:hypothetical protein
MTAVPLITRERGSSALERQQISYHLCRCPVVLLEPAHGTGPWGVPLYPPWRGVCRAPPPALTTPPPVEYFLRPDQDEARTRPGNDHVPTHRQIGGHSHGGAKNPREWEPLSRPATRLSGTPPDPRGEHPSHRDRAASRRDGLPVLRAGPVAARRLGAVAGGEHKGQATAIRHAGHGDWAAPGLTLEEIADAWALPNGDEGQPLHTAAAQGPDASLRCEQMGLEVQHLVPQVREVFLDLGLD